MPSVTDATFDQQVVSAPLAIVEFWNERCPNCTRFGPVYQEVASEMAGKILMLTANTDENQKKAAAYGISGVPTVIFFSNGKEVGRVSGAMEKGDFLNQIARYLAPGGPAEKGGAPAEEGAPTDSVGNVLVGGAVIAAVVYGLTQLT